MYGLGIRLGYYLQWFGIILASPLVPDEVPNFRFALAHFMSATFLALIIQTPQRNLYSVEIYVILLLTFGAYISLVPFFLWRLMTGCNPLLDPTRFPLVDAGPTSSDLHALRLLAVTGFQLWFWIAKVPESNGLDCVRYGFMFARVPLNNLAFQVIDIVLYFILGIIVLVVCALRVRSLLTDPDGDERMENWREGIKKYRKSWIRRRNRRLQQLNLFNNLIIASTITTATELTMRWNRITNVNEVTFAGQLIPFVIGLGGLVRILYVWRKRGFPYFSDQGHRPRPTASYQIASSHVPPLPPPTARHSYLKLYGRGYRIDIERIGQAVKVQDIPRCNTKTFTLARRYYATMLHTPATIRSSPSLSNPAS